MIYEVGMLYLKDYTKMIMTKGTKKNTKVIFVWPDYQ